MLVCFVKQVQIALPTDDAVKAAIDEARLAESGNEDKCILINISAWEALVHMVL